MIDPPSRPPSRTNLAGKLQEFAEFALADQDATLHRGKWREFFTDRMGNFSGRIIFEIGCSDAAFLSRIAAKHPTTAFVGLDWKYKAVYDAARRITDLNLRNVALLRARAQDVLKIFTAREVDEIWLFHPDPCDQPKELANRLFAPRFLRDVHQVLRGESSCLCLKTDHRDYYQWALALFGLPEALPQQVYPLAQYFRVHANSHDFWNDDRALEQTAKRLFSGEMTSFETRFTRKKLPIYYLEICKREATSPPPSRS